MLFVFVSAYKMLKWTWEDIQKQAYSMHYGKLFCI